MPQKFLWKLKVIGWWERVRVGGGNKGESTEMGDRDTGGVNDQK